VCECEACLRVEHVEKKKKKRKKCMNRSIGSGQLVLVYECLCLQQ
jgi:hypothetical protein